MAGSTARITTPRTPARGPAVLPRGTSQGIESTSEWGSEDALEELVGSKQGEQVSPDVSASTRLRRGAVADFRRGLLPSRRDKKQVRIECISWMRQGTRCFGG